MSKDAVTTARAGSRRRGIPRSMIVVIVLFVALYGVVAFSYAKLGHAPESKPVATPESGVLFEVTPRTVNAEAATIDVELRLADGADLTQFDGLTMTRDLRLMVSTIQGNELQTYLAGTPAAPKTLTLAAEGTIESWPFDRYRGESIMMAYAPGASGDASDWSPLPIALNLGDHHIPGWVITFEKRKAFDIDDDAGTSFAVYEYSIVAKRAQSTIVFAAVLLALMVAMPVLGLTVALLILRGKRRVESSFMGWNAGMLFAVIPLRNFLPGQPPVGSWIDFLIVLWVIAGLILALIISVVAWYRWERPLPESR